MSLPLRFARLFTAGLVAASAACAASRVSEPAQESAARTALPRNLTPAEQSVLAASNAFTFALWQQINQTQRDSNVFVSPLSASFSVGMTLAGAAGTTLDDLRTGLRFGNATVTDIDAGYKSLIDLLTSLDPSVTMSIANSIWYENGFPFYDSFLNSGATYFGATIHPLNFDDAAGSLSTINGWVNTQTHGRIPTILDQIERDNVMFLINAIYFKGSWREKFDPKLTHDAPFHAVGGDQTAHLMNREAHFSYFNAPTFTAVDLAYGDSAFTMTAILPKSGTSVETLAASLDSSTWRSITAGFRTATVNLFFPKLTLSWKRDLIPDLKGLGMHAPFVPNGADFTGMSSRGRDLYISSVRQKTFVAIDEEGTEAAAVTSTGISATSLQIPETIVFDRPFLFVIRERFSGTVLFAGKIVRLP